MMTSKEDPMRLQRLQFNIKVSSSRETGWAVTLSVVGMETVEQAKYLGDMLAEFMTDGGKSGWSIKAIP